MDSIAGDYFNEGIEDQIQLDQEPLKKLDTSQPTTATGCFDCNICLDFAMDPVVTLCGHLYCWPCIYKWLHVDTVSSKQCPVCKAPVSENSLVPLYGRGHISKNPSQNTSIPRRPSPVQTVSDANENQVRHGHQHYHLHHHHHYPLDDYISSSSTRTTTRMMHSTAGGVLGGLAFAVLPWVCRNNQEVASVQYESPFSVGSPRMRRQEIEVEMSLHQIWLFLVCCAVLCLLLF